MVYAEGMIAAIDKQLDINGCVVAYKGPTAGDVEKPP